MINDVLSQTGQPLPCADLWLAQPQAQRILQSAQLVLQFGSSLTGKRLLQWQVRCRPEEYWLIDDLPGRLDLAHHRGRRIRASVAQWLALHPAQSSVRYMMCDLIIAADNAIFGQTRPKVGSFDGGWGASYMARIVGQKKAREIWFLCRQYDAAAALEMGLVNTVVPFGRSGKGNRALVPRNTAKTARWHCAA